MRDDGGENDPRNAMNWKAKAVVQNLIALLPRPLGDTLYFQLQRRLGAFRALDRAAYFEAASRMESLARAHGRAVEDAVIVEVGAGWDLAVAVGLWLGGARRVVAVDLHRHLRPELFREVLAFLRDEPERAESALGSLARSRTFAARRAFALRALEQPDPIPVPGEIEYRAPADASHLPMPDHSADLHVSRSVLEHVPAREITALLEEGRRVLAPGGLFVHVVDFTDHFSHSDPSLSSVNFLRYSARAWNRLGGNRFMYHNRMRVDDLASLFREAKMGLNLEGVRIDDRALRELTAGHPVDPGFGGKTPETLATAEAWFVAEAR